MIGIPDFLQKNIIEITMRERTGMKRIISFCLAVSSIVGLLSGMPTAASEGTEKVGWRLSQVRLNHGTASFTLDDVEFAQEATLYIEKVVGQLKYPFLDDILYKLSNVEV